MQHNSGSIHRVLSALFCTWKVYVTSILWKNQWNIYLTNVISRISIKVYVAAMHPPLSPLPWCRIATDVFWVHIQFMPNISFMVYIYYWHALNKTKTLKKLRTDLDQCTRCLYILSVAYSCQIRCSMTIFSADNSQYLQDHSFFCPKIKGSIKYPQRVHNEANFVQDLQTNMKGKLR